MTEELNKPKVEEFMEIGGSPMPGITLRHILRGHTGSINRIAWSPDGRFLASPSRDGTIRIWDTELGENKAVLRLNVTRVLDLAWSMNGRVLVSGSAIDTSVGKSVSIWDTDSMKILYSFGEESCYSVTPSPDGKNFTVGIGTDLIICNPTSRNPAKIFKLKKEYSSPYSILWIPNTPYIALTSSDKSIPLLNTSSKTTHQVLSGHSTSVWDIVWLPAKRLLVSASLDGTIRVWDVNTLKQVSLVEGHTDGIRGLSLSHDERLLASKSWDGSIRIWNCDTWETVGVIAESYNSAFGRVSFNPSYNILATFGKEDQVIRIWDIDYNALVGNTLTEESIRYTTAKLVLVGDSGVGKTGLGWRLAHNEFKEHSSTHGQQFWVVPELKKTREDGTECEAVLWDLAGQPDYRLVHSLYLDDVDAALVLFDPTNRQEPLAGVDFWLNQLKDKDKKLRNSILVGARTDRGTSTLTDAEIQAYCERNEVSGGYISTSALKGDGLPELMERLNAQIPWDQMTATITTVTFKRIKEYILSLKEKTKRRKVLVQPSELRKQLEKTDRKWKFSDAEMMTAVRHLENHGYVKVLHGSSGEQTILLSPDILANLASSIVLEARRNPRGLGVLEETQLLLGKYLFPELVKVSENERKILLDAAAVLFLEHNLCFRETFNEQTFLVFPSLINEKRPIDESSKTVEGETYQVKGAVENLYASMVVLLGYTNTFVRTHQWQNQAQYEMGKGEVCGFQQISYPDNSIELVLNYGEKTPDPVRLMFRGLFERFLSRRELEIARYQTVICKYCSSLLARNVVLDQLNKGKKFTYCHECGKKVMLPSPEPLTRLSPKEEVEIDTQQVVANYRTAFEAALVRVKGLLRDRKKKKKPTCFISYAWGVSENERWVLQLAKDLRNAEIDVLIDRWNSPPGSNLDLYIERILSSDFVIPVGTPELRKKYDTKKADPVVAAELKLINLRVRQPTEYGDTVLPVLLTGTAKTSFTPQLQPLVSVDFREVELYFRKLFDMIWRLYNLPFDHPQLEELQASMTPQKR